MTIENGGKTSVFAYKAFNADLSCRGFKYEIGKSYEIEGDPDPCSRGFHACLHPVDVFGYCEPGRGTRFAEVECFGSVGEGDKIAAKRITIKREISLGDLIDAAVKRTFACSTPEEGASATGTRGAASATGYSGAASATGTRGAASAEGSHSVALASGPYGKARAIEGGAIFLVERHDDGSIAHVFAGVAGRDAVKPMTWYRLEGGKLTEVEP